MSIIRWGERISVRVSKRSLVIGAVAALVLLVISVLTLTAGDLGIALPNLLPAVVSSPGGKEGFVLERLRGPRLVVAVLTGAAFGISGALFQTVTRNPLGSPDIIGIGVGAGAGAAAFGLVWPGILPLPVGALIGALVAIVLVWFGTGRGFSSPSRVIIVGIGVSAMGLSFIQYVIARAGREEATVLAAYLNGSLASRDWADAAIIVGALLVLVPAALLLGRRLALIEMGDEAADALGANARGTRTWSILVAVGLSTAAVSVAGPIAFVALASPQVAKRLARSPGANIALSAVMGAVMLTLADLAVQQAPFGVQLPVGILTAVIGGLYLGYLLVREWKKGTL
ncbi:MAG: iron chelate uptake ABC transporter family permease subunit [Burkholderiaceae bacterium]|nr:iron chelate uptake ABC transporter family permease subunit [Microbacteriaceae bacterium]